MREFSQVDFPAGYFPAHTYTNASNLFKYVSHYYRHTLFNVKVIRKFNLKVCSLGVCVCFSTLNTYLRDAYVCVNTHVDPEIFLMKLSICRALLVKFANWHEGEDIATIKWINFAQRQLFEIVNLEYFLRD